MVAEKSSKSTTYLDDNFHQILLGDNVFTVNHLFKDARKNHSLVQVQVHAVKLTESHQIRPNKDTEFASFHFTFFPVARMSLMLETDPKLIHLNEVGQNERYRILKTSCRTTTGSYEHQYSSKGREALTRSQLQLGGDLLFAH